jgi:uncharacterized protein DUF433
MITAEDDPFIVVDAIVQGGMPVIRGTRMTVYSVLGRIEHGDTIWQIIQISPAMPWKPPWPTRERIHGRSALRAKPETHAS